MVQTKEPLRILQVLPELNEGGVERGAVEMNRELVKRGIDSYVMSKGGLLAKRIQRDGGRHVALDVCSKNPLTAPWRALSLRRVLKEIRPSILHARSRVPAWLCRLANRSLKIPFVTTVHGINSVNRYSKVMTSGDQVICVGEPVRRHVSKHYAPDPAKLTVIPRGVDMEAFDPRTIDSTRTDDLRQKLGLADKVVIGSVGRISRVKDFETVIAAIGLLSSERQDLQGLIVGGTRPDKQNYADDLKQLGESTCPDRIIWAGSRSDMPAIYACCDIIINASPLMGNVARTLLEALAMDVPVLSTQLEGLEQLVRDGVNGYLFKTGDADDLAAKLKLLLDGPALHPRETIPEEFTLERMVESTLSIYRSLNR
jgi:glycosyltransferase involved in cell wall biosynthesis